MGMGTRLYPLSDADKDGIKVWYPLSLGMGIGINFFRDRYKIVKLVSVSPVAIPSDKIGIKIKKCREYFVRFFFSYDNQSIYIHTLQSYLIVALIIINNIRK